MTRDDDDGRDGHGRWKKGHCPNPNGRPRKKPAISDADVNHFRNTMVSVMINGEQRWVTRHELLLHSMFEQAIKGKSVLLQRMLFARFESSDELNAKLHMTFKEVTKKLLDGYYATGKIDEKLFEDVEELRYFVKNGDPDRPVRQRRRPRIKRMPAGTASWRKGPKPQSLIDLERQEEAELLAEAKECARRRGLTVDDDDEPVDF